LLGAALVATNGWASPDVARAYARARELCAETGITPQLFPVLLGLCGFSLMRGQLAIADELSRQLLVVAEATHDDAALLGGHNAAGLFAMYSGDYPAALRHLERSKAIYDPARHAPNPRDGFTIDHDPGVSCASHEALTLLILGRFEAAAARMRECLAHARALDHALSVAMGYNFAATLYQLRREPDVVQELEEVRLDYSQRHDFTLFLMLGEIYRGWLLAERGSPEEGADRMQQGLAVYQAIGAELGRPTFLGMFAAVCTEIGRDAEARAAVEEALDLSAATGLRYWDAELHRLQGVIALAEAAAGATEAAEASFRRALAVAREQSARLFELRAATSLGRLWQDAGRRDEASTLLAEVLAPFADAEPIADLRDARALYADLTGAAGDG
jgi:predicted ATPase